MRFTVSTETCTDLKIGAARLSLTSPMTLRAFDASGFSRKLSASNPQLRFSTSLTGMCTKMDLNSHSLSSLSCTWTLSTARRPYIPWRGSPGWSTKKQANSLVRRWPTAQMRSVYPLVQFLAALRSPLSSSRVLVSQRVARPVSQLWLLALVFWPPCSLRRFSPQYLPGQPAALLFL